MLANKSLIKEVLAPQTICLYGRRWQNLPLKHILQTKIEHTVNIIIIEQLMSTVKRMQNHSPKIKIWEPI